MTEPINEATDDVSTGETRQRILDAAFRVFLGQGYKGATTRLIAQEAGVNEVTIFRHFGNKLKLMEAVLDDATGISDFERVLQEELTGDIRTDLQFLMKYIAGGMRRTWETMHLFMCEVHRIPELQEIMHQKWQERQQLFEVYFQAQINNGVLRDDVDPDLLIHTFRGAIFTYGRNVREEGIASDDLDAKVSQLTDILLNGCLARTD